jgi:hypothetical protein
MKYIITESKIYNIIDRLFLERYGKPLVKDEWDDYTWFKDESGNAPFEMNLAGTLWVNDYTMYRNLRSLLGFNNSETDELLKNYFEDNFDVKVTSVGSEGGYSLKGDDPEYGDPHYDADSFE